MPPIPAELFRRKLAHRYLMKAIAAIQQYRDVAVLDYQAAAEAGFYVLAALVVKEVKRDDLMYEFERLAEEAIRKAVSAAPLRVHTKKPKKRPLIPVNLKSDNGQ